jgi:hypothetical protein
MEYDAMFHNYGSIGTVVDRKALNKVPSNQLIEVMKLLDFHQGPIVVVDDVKTFYSFDAITKAIDAGNPDNDVALRLAKYNIAFSDRAASLVREMFELKKQLAESFKDIEPEVTLPSYNFAKVPEGWSVKTYLTIYSSKDRTKIYRNKDSHYYIGEKTAERLWNSVAPFWNGSNIMPPTYTVSAAGYNKRVSFSLDGVTIGCQIIRRYELEQLALHLGWKFPNNNR